jgi:hypothetical protein
MVRTLLLAALLVPLPGVGLRAQTADSVKVGERKISLEAVKPGADNLSMSEWARRQLDAANSKPQPLNIADRLDRVRALYVLSVEEKRWMESAEDTLSSLRPLLGSGSEETVVAEAYRGALEVVRAKHARWPGNKLKHLDRGGDILNELVATHPDNLEVRYLRLASYLFLPFFLKRDDEVKADLAALTAGLPEGRQAFSPWMYQGVVRFVLENGDLDEETRARLAQRIEQST